MDYCESGKLRSFHKKQLFEFCVNGVRPSSMYAALVYLFSCFPVSEDGKKEFVHRIHDMKKQKHFTEQFVKAVDILLQCASV